MSSTSRSKYFSKSTKESVCPNHSRWLTFARLSQALRKRREDCGALGELHRRSGLKSAFQPELVMAPSLTSTRVHCLFFASFNKGNKREVMEQNINVTREQMVELL